MSVTRQLYLALNSKLRFSNTYMQIKYFQVVQCIIDLSLDCNFKKLDMHPTLSKNDGLLFSD